MREPKIEEIFLRKPATILIMLKNCRTASDIWRKTNFAYTYILKVLKSFEKLGLIKRERKGKGRAILIEMTPEGKELAEDFEKIK